MATRTEVTRKQSKDPLPAARLPGDLIEALGNLNVPSSIESDQDESSGERILLDADFDGDRYLLVRMPRIRARAQVTLSPRELEIVRMVAQGHSNKIIADVLTISSWTVCTHIRRIFAKLGVSSRAAMVAQLLKCGLLPSQVPLRPHTHLDRSSTSVSRHHDLRSFFETTAGSRPSSRAK